MKTRKMRSLKKLTVILLTVAMLSSVLCVGVLADVELQAQEYVEVKIYDTMDYDVVIADYEVYDLPNGMAAYVRNSNTEIWIAGTPPPGFWNISCYAWLADAYTDEYVGEQAGGISIYVHDPTPAPTATAAPVTQAPVTAAPATKAPTATAAPATRAPQPGLPQITQQPMDVTVEKGHDCKFTANAKDYTWLAWRFVSADGQKEIIFDVIGNNFPGLKVTGGNSLQFNLTNVPVELDGWRAVCMFGNNAGRVTTQGAEIRVTSPAAVLTATAAPATEAPAPTPTTAPAPTAPTVTEAPANDQPAEKPSEAPEETAEPEEEEPAKSNTGLIVALCVVGALLVVCVVVLIIVMNKKKKRRNDDYYGE